MSTQAQIIEIFRSVQGEGKYVGVPQAFVRFAGCNLSCPWCDTTELCALKPALSYSIDSLWQELEPLTRGVHSVSLTGGEPLMQKDFLKAFLPFLKKNGLKTFLETNGTLPEELGEVIDQVDIVAMDFKLPTSNSGRDFWSEHDEFLRVSRAKEVFIKAVISQKTGIADIMNMVNIIEQQDPTIPLFLQPNFFEMDERLTSRCGEFLDYCRMYLADVRVLPQVHKFMNIR